MVVAGRFYSGTEQGCRAHLGRVDAKPSSAEGLPDRLVAAIVPHAGWDCSGRVAMEVYRTVAARLPGDVTFILFGTVHHFGVARASVCTLGSWATPLGPVQIDNELAERLLADGQGRLIADSDAHISEHSLEVQMPMLKYVFGDRPMVAVAAPPRDDSHEVGRLVVEIARSAGRQVFIIGTTDLTHYGASGYGFAPRGGGAEALRWVKEDNDARMIDLMQRLAGDQVVAEARRHHNACGAGAIAATLGAARAMGASCGHLLQYTTSYDVLKDQLYGDQIGDFVGYAGMVF
jgi:AmmeMemoRadiSam system protein B